MGLAVPDDEDSPTPSPSQPWAHSDSFDSDKDAAAAGGTCAVDVVTAGGTALCAPVDAAMVASGPMYTPGRCSQVMVLI